MTSKRSFQNIIRTKIIVVSINYLNDIFWNKNFHVIHANWKKNLQAHIFSSKTRLWFFMNNKKTFGEHVNRCGKWSLDRSSFARTICEVFLGHIISTIAHKNRANFGIALKHVNAILCFRYHYIFSFCVC